MKWGFVELLEDYQTEVLGETTQRIVQTPELEKVVDLFQQKYLNLMYWGFVERLENLGPLSTKP